MCGIFGAVWSGEEVALSRESLVRCTRAMTHRGPDDEGYHLGPGVALGHRRLSIIDLSGGHQPIYNEDGTLCIIFNGEVYNYQPLRADLVRAGHIFRTSSDTEVILHAYEEYGQDCLAKFRGIFAIAIYDKRTGELFLGRDHLGVKPLYYREVRGGVLFSSEIKPILEACPSRVEYDPGMVDFFLSLGYTPNPHTFFRDVKKIPPGAFARVRGGKIQIQKYWSLESLPAARVEPFPESLRTLKSLLRDSVELQLVSEVPVGVFLSGGLDSSAVVAVMRQLDVGEIKTFSVGYKDFRDVSELSFAKKVSAQFGTKHFEFHLEFGEFFHSIETMLEFSEEPLVESAAIALYHLARLARTEATVLLSGEGSDEIFAGYPIYPRMKTLERMSRVAALLPGKFVERLRERLYLTEKQEKYIDWISVPFEARYKTVPNDVTTTIRNEMYTSEFREFAGTRVEEFFRKELEEGPEGSPLSRMLRLDTKYWLPDDLLLKADKMTMAASIELRVPFLDPRLVEFANSLPDRYKLRGRAGKYILKKAMEGILPDEIIHRAKKGFPVPIRQWFKEGLHEETREILLSEKFLSRGIIRREYVDGILRSHRSGKEDHSRRIFSLLTLEMWMRRFVEEKSCT